MKLLKLPKGEAKKIAEFIDGDIDCITDWAYNIGRLQVTIKTLKLIQDVYKFAGRPTKDGAKLLRAKASKLEEAIKTGKV